MVTGPKSSPPRKNRKKAYMCSIFSYNITFPNIVTEIIPVFRWFKQIFSAKSDYFNKIPFRFFTFPNQVILFVKYFRSTNHLYAVTIAGHSIQLDASDKTWARPSLCPVSLRTVADLTRKPPQLCHFPKRKKRESSLLMV